MKNKINLYALLIIVFSATLPCTADAQANIVKTVGKIILTEALGTVVRSEVERTFYPTKTGGSNSSGYSQANYGNNYRNPIVVTVANDLYSLTYFWVTTDGYYWYPYVLEPGQYFKVKSENAGIIGIFNGYKVDVLVQGGSYYSSQFF